MTIIERLKSALGYTWAASCLIVILATFVGLNFWERTLAKRIGIHVSPVFSGGEVRQTIDHSMYRTLVHRMVFDGLISERTQGFVQIDWAPKEKQALPAILEEDFDIDGDSLVEFSVRVDTNVGSVQVIRKAPWVLGTEPLVAIDSEKILRVRLQNPHR
jgi:hypothetical protein